MKLLLRLVAIVVIVSCLVLKAGAQTSSGQISGKIVDPAGASIANAPVRLTNQLTGEVREAKTVSSGEFVLPGSSQEHFQYPFPLAALKPSKSTT
jgi:hypothetical protein